MQVIHKRLTTLEAGDKLAWGDRTFTVIRPAVSLPDNSLNLEVVWSDSGLHDVLNYACDHKCEVIEGQAIA